MKEAKLSRKRKVTSKISGPNLLSGGLSKRCAMPASLCLIACLPSLRPPLHEANHSPHHPKTPNPSRRGRLLHSDGDYVTGVLETRVCLRDGTQGVAVKEGVGIMTEGVIADRLPAAEMC